jgi:hypothetical protein
MAIVARSHRKAYGPQRAMSPTVKARNVAASIRTREQEGRPWNLVADYGVTDPAQQALVLAALAEGV